MMSHYRCIELEIYMLSKWSPSVGGFNGPVDADNIISTVRQILQGKVDIFSKHCLQFT